MGQALNRLCIICTRGGPRGLKVQARVVLVAKESAKSGQVIVIEGGL